MVTLAAAWWVVTRMSVGAAVEEELEHDVVVERARPLMVYCLV